MDAKEFTDHPSVKQIIHQLREDEIDQKIFSDVLDQHGHQYVDLVQEGGGVLGFSLLGYTYVLEKMGLRFLNIAGTSAGAINTLLLASIGRFHESKSEQMIEEFAKVDLLSFLDHDKTVKNVLKTLVNKEDLATSIWHVLWNGFRLRQLLRNRLGINSGDAFHQWLTNILKKNGIHTTSDLQAKRSYLPEDLHIRENVERSVKGLDTSIVIIAADITTQTKVRFPEMNDLYWQNPSAVNPADYVRASMSIPFLFRPYVVKNLPKDDKASKRWLQKVSYSGPIPEKVQFVDGGLMSNFPIDAFHVRGVPRLPSFGIKLGVNRENPKFATDFKSYLRSLINGMRQVHDFEFLVQHRDYEKLIQTVDVGDHIWFDFDIPAEDKVDLFLRGVKAADEFLRRFNWQEYKQLRYHKLIQFHGHP